MKKLFKTLAVLAISSTLALANNAPKAFKVGMYNVQNTNTLKVFIDKETSDALTLEIKDANGVLLQKEVVAKNKSKAGLSVDMSQLEAGNYSLTISSKDYTYSKDLEIKKEKKEELKIVI